ncbi:MAG: hypothetical protein PF517_11335 [Salinivirgaceae bacterium]|jgi:hypothetical protein|nr:hypothetical protein [Salinivirgaceae bacterium]
MKQLSLFATILFFSIQTLVAQQIESKKFSVGIMAMGGGRYDDVRMCVASPAGVKGGPIGDIMLAFRHRKNDKFAFVFNLPVFRPVLFAAAFNLLQFEPEVNFEIHKAINEKRNFFSGPGLGLSLNYGPDYKSNKNNPTESFFSIGPIINYQVGFLFKTKVQNSIVLKAFYIPLFSSNGHDNGNVAGGALQYALYF